MTTPRTDAVATPVSSAFPAAPVPLIRVVGISGSLRLESFNTSLLHAFAQVAGPQCAMTVQSLSGIPLYDDDLRLRGTPQSVQRMGEAIRRADAVVIASPEYNYSIPGVLKNAVDWISRLPDQPFSRKPVAIMGASTGRLGTARAQYHLRQCFQFLDARLPNKPEVFVADAASAFRVGHLVDEGARAALHGLWLALIEKVPTRRQALDAIHSST